MYIVVIGFRKRRCSYHAAFRYLKEEAGRAISHGHPFRHVVEEEAEAEHMAFGSSNFGK